MNNNIKLIIYCAFVALLSFPVNAQEEFNKFDNQININTISVNKKMFDMMASVKMDTSNKENQAYLNLIKKLSSLKVYTTNNDKWSLEMKNTTSEFVKKRNLEELMSISDNGSNIKIYVKTETTDTLIKQLLMFSEGISKTETIIFLLSGNFDLNEIPILTDRMNIPGTESLKKNL